jgi:hypothetical protein
MKNDFSPENSINVAGISFSLFKNKYSPFALKAYASALAADAGLEIVFSGAQAGPNTIVLPDLEYTEDLSKEAYSIYKGVIDHEAALRLFTDVKRGLLLRFDDSRDRRIIRRLEDLRADAFMARRYAGIGPDSRTLRAILADQGLAGNASSCTERGYWAAVYGHFYGYASRPGVNRELAPFLERSLPFIEAYTASESPDHKKAAAFFRALLEPLFEEEEQAAPEFDPDARRDSSPGEDIADMEGGDDDEAAEKMLAQVIPKKPPTDETVRPHRDIIRDWRDYAIPKEERDKSVLLHEKVMEKVKYSAHRYRELFSAVLYSTGAAKKIETHSGSLNKKRLHQLATAFNPRIFIQRVTGRKKGYDITILVDGSGSMSSIYNEKNKAYTAYLALCALAGALHGLKGINLELLAFSTLPCTEGGLCEEYNFLLAIKSFAESSAGGLRLFPAIFSAEMQKNNFDAGALTAAAGRLARLASGNNKALIVISDGLPASAINSSAAVLRKAIADIDGARLRVIGIGIGPDCGTEALYPRGIRVRRPEDLETVLFTEIAGLLSPVN